MTDPTYASSTDWCAGHGVTMTIGSTTGIEVVSIGDLTMTATKIDVTSHSSTSNIKKFIGGLVEIADIPVTIRFNKSVVSAFQTTLTAAFQTAQSITVTFPFTTPETATFSAIVTAVGVTIPDDDKITTNVTLTPTSEITWA